MQTRTTIDHPLILLF